MFKPEEIREITFEKVMRGYRTEDVESFLNKIADEMQTSEKEKEKLEDQLFVLAEKIEQYRVEEENIKKTLISAQKLGENIVADAHKKAELILRDANIKKNDILAGAHDEANYYEANLKRMKHEVSDFRETILNLYKTHIESLSLLPKEEKEEQPVVEEEQQTAPVEEIVETTAEVKQETEFNKVSALFE